MTPDERLDLLEKEMKEVRKFISTVEGGRKTLLCIITAAGGAAALVAAFWQQLFGRTP